jgi:3-methylfumaryl-CoA hydratase
VSAIDIDYLKQWIGREEREGDIACAAPLAGLAGMLDHDAPPWPDGELPPLGHWLFFLPKARQSSIAEDGHPQRGALLPPVPLQRRMWAGGSLVFHAPIRIGRPLERHTSVRDVSLKSGGSGEMVFVVLQHEISDADGTLCVTERQDLVYRGQASGGTSPDSAAPGDAPVGSIRRTIVPDPVLLFRFSALTFNGHRIHYDRDYARGVEGYPGLVVHAPLSATLLIDHFLRETPGAAVSEFQFRAQRPLFDSGALELHLERDEGGADLWVTGPDGRPAMTAKVRTR